MLADNPVQDRLCPGDVIGISDAELQVNPSVLFQGEVS